MARIIKAAHLHIVYRLDRDTRKDGDAIIALEAAGGDDLVTELLEPVGELVDRRFRLLQAEYVRLLLLQELLYQPRPQPHRVDVPCSDCRHVPSRTRSPYAAPGRISQVGAGKTRDWRVQKRKGARRGAPGAALFGRIGRMRGNPPD